MNDEHCLFTVIFYVKNDFLIVSRKYNAFVIVCKFYEYCLFILMFCAKSKVFCIYNKKGSCFLKQADRQIF